MSGAPAAPQAGRQASQQEQAMFDTMARQALDMLTSEQGARALHKLATSSGPDQAIAQMVTTVLDGVQQAAEGAGVAVSPDVRSAAGRTAAELLSQLLVKGGLGDDAEGMATAAIGQMEGGGQAAEVMA